MQRTLTQSDRTTKWGLFRHDAAAFNSDTVLQGNWYGSELEAIQALDGLNKFLPALLKKTIITKQVNIDPADQKKIYNYA